MSYLKSNEGPVGQSYLCMTKLIARGIINPRQHVLTPGGTGGPGKPSELLASNERLAFPFRRVVSAPSLGGHDGLGVCLARSYACLLGGLARRVPHSLFGDLACSQKALRLCWSRQMLSAVNAW